MIFLDAGFFIALLERRDELHKRAAAWGSRLPAPALVSEYALWEVLNFFAASAGRGKACQLVQRIRSDRKYIVARASPELFEAGFHLYMDRPDKHWSLTDCISFHLMNDRGIH